MQINSSSAVTPIPQEEPKPKKKPQADPLAKVDLSALKNLDAWQVDEKMAGLVQGLSDDVKAALYGKIETVPVEGMSIGIIAQGKGTNGARDFGIQGVYHLKTTVHETHDLDFMPEAIYSGVALMGRMGSQEVAAGVQYRVGYEMKDMNRLEEMMSPINAQGAFGMALVSTAAVGARYQVGAFAEGALGLELSAKFPNSKITAYVMPEVVGRVGAQNDVFARVQAGIRLPLN